MKTSRWSAFPRRRWIAFCARKWMCWSWETFASSAKVSYKLAPPMEDNDCSDRAGRIFFNMRSIVPLVVILAGAVLIVPSLAQAQGALQGTTLGQRQNDDRDLANSLV